MGHRTAIGSALVALAISLGVQVRAYDLIAIAVDPSTGVVQRSPQWAVNGIPAGFQPIAQDLLLGGGPSQFYSITSAAIPSGGDMSAFVRYLAGSGGATNLPEIGSALTPNSYSALTSAEPDVGYGSFDFYSIHHKSSGDYLTVIVPGSGAAPTVTDVKPMAGPGGPNTPTTSGYSALTFAAADLGYGPNRLYYLRADSLTGATKFGTLDPAPTGASLDRFDLGATSYIALVYASSNVGFGPDKMYYLRRDQDTGYAIFGTLDPMTGHVADIANLGSVFTTLSFAPADVGFGPARFYTTGFFGSFFTIFTQSVSFAAIADRPISAGPFTVAPTVDSGLLLTLSVTSDSTGAASITGPVAGVYTVTPTAPGRITLIARVSGNTHFEPSSLRQSFTATGAATLSLLAQPASQTAVAGSTVSFSVMASGTTALSYQWFNGGHVVTGNPSATTATLTVTNVQASDPSGFEVWVTNASGTIHSNLALLTVVPTLTAPSITNDPLTAPGTVGIPFSYAITVSNFPTSYGANGLPTGLTIDSLTGRITGTPTLAGTSTATISATNNVGTGTATLTISIGPAITAQPANATVVPGGSATSSVGMGEGVAATYQWKKDGVDLLGATTGTLPITNVQPGDVGLYAVAVSSGGGITTSSPAILGISASGKLVGLASLVGTNIVHPNGNVYDQVLLQGAAAAVTADPGKITRTSFIDLTDDIVQIEFSGAGTLSLVLDAPTGPALPMNYNQDVRYMKGNARIVITGANDSTNVSVFTVGRATAFDPSGGFNILLPISSTNNPANNGSALFQGHGTTNYDGVADVAFIAIMSTNGKFGGVRTADASYLATKGVAGIYAPEVQFLGPVYLGDLNASGTANPMVLLGSAANETWVAGGNLLQTNGQPVQVSGITRLNFVAGSTSDNRLLPVQVNKAVLMQNGVDVTAQIVVNPSP